MLLLAALVLAQTISGWNQADEDHYTRYELLEPSSSSFRILYEVTASTAGATRYWNPIRPGSVATDERVFNPENGARLPFEVVTGEVARRNGHARAALDTEYIQVTLPRAVPQGGGIRLLIDKTYKDPKSYFVDAATGEIVFTRSLGIRRNAVVLPGGYEIVACNTPSQIATEADGRVRASYLSAGPDAVSFALRGRKVDFAATPAAPAAGPPAAASAAPATPSAPATRGPALPPPPSADRRLVERARQDREIVYFLHPPETHAFSLYHDVTIRDVGRSTYLNVVRAGSTVSDPSAVNLDTGEALSVETLKGDAITKASIDIGEPVTARSEVVVIRFPAVRAGTSVRLRIRETYTDPARYRVDGGLLVWDRSFGRPYNDVVLPAGYALAASAVPATVSAADDGRVRLAFVNPRNDEISVLILARRRRLP